MILYGVTNSDDLYFFKNAKKTYTKSVPFSSQCDYVGYILLDSF